MCETLGTHSDCWPLSLLRDEVALAEVCVASWRSEATRRLAHYREDYADARRETAYKQAVYRLGEEKIRLDEARAALRRYLADHTPADHQEQQAA